MGFKKWLAAITGSGMLGMAAAGGGVIGLVVIGVTGYNILMEPDKLPEEEEEDIAKVHRLGYGECECNCVYIGEAGDTSGGGGTGSVSNSATGSGPVTFTGTEDKNDFPNSVFYFNKIVCDELGLPMWTLYAVNSGETGGSAYKSGAVTWNGNYNGIDGSVALRFGNESAVRPSKNEGAAGFFQVQWNSIKSEMGYMTNNFDKYQGIISKSGIDTNKYPGLQAGLEKEVEEGYTNWYQDCTYYPAAAINAAEALLERKQIAAEKEGWLKSFDWYNNASQAEKDVIDYYVALTLWNNGPYAIETEYVNRDLYGIYLEAFLYVIKNKSDEFFSQPYNKTTGNGAQEIYGPETDGNLEPTRWVLANAPNITPEIKKRFEDEFIKPRLPGKNGWKNQFVKRFCCYSTNNIFNAMTKSNQYSVVNNLAQHGITITGGWSLLSSGNTSNLGENGSGGTTSSGGNSGGSSTVTLDANGISERVDNVIYVGDSRFVGMESYTKKGGDFLVAKVSMGYSWFTSDAMSSIQSIKASNPNVKDWTIVSNLGVNDLYNIDNYISKYQEMQNSGDNIIVVSVNPTDKSHDSLNTEIDDFNNKLKSSGLTYIDTNSVLKSDGFETSDGLHYKKDTYIKIWNEINKGLASSSGGLSSSTRTPSKKINTATNNSNRNSGGTGNLGSSGSKVELGKYVEDAVLNPQGMPLYDNYTFDPNKYTYRDRNYEQFWDGSTPESDILYGLGDFTNEGAKNRITYEGGPVNNKTKKTINFSPAFERKGSYALADGRIVFAIAPAIGANDSDLALLQSLVTDEHNYSKPTWSDPDVLNGNGNVGGYSGETSWGLYFDIVLDNGTVVPCVVGDTKAMHHGVWDGQWHDDRLSKGYCQLKYNLNRTTLGYKSIIETCYGNSNEIFTSTLFNGRKISSIRTYEIFHNAATGWNRYWTQGGSDSSFGLTGGSSTGGAKPGGTGNAAAGGTGGGTTTTTTGLNPNDPNWKCDCDIPCSKCMCHDNGVGGKPVDSSGDTIGGGGTSSVSATLQATPGLPQGLYCDLSGNQLTPEQVWDMFQKSNPQGSADYQAHIGLAPTIEDVTENDTFVGKFGDTIGVLHFMQTRDMTPWGGLKMKFVERYGNGYSSAVNPRNGESDLNVHISGSGCGWTGCSIIASTMLHRYITPPEVIMASYISPQINPEVRGSFLGMFAQAGAGAQVSPNNDNFWNTLRYNGEKLFTIQNGQSPINQAKVDATLDAGGMVLMCVGPSDFTSGGHYIVIRSKRQAADGSWEYFTVDGAKAAGSTGDPNKPRTFQYLSSVGRRNSGPGDQATYVTPGPGYQKYLDSLSSGGTGSTGNLSTGNGESTTTPDGVTITEHMLSESSRHLADLWKNESGKIPTDAKVFVFKPKNPNGHSVTIDAGHGNNSHPAVSLRTESVFPGLSADQIRGMGSSDTNNKSSGVEGRDSKNVFDGKEIEPECTLAVAIKVRDKLLAKGYTVTMTRNLSTQNLSNGTRSVLGCETSEIYVAIHTNGGGGRGVITFYPGDFYAGQGGGPRPGYTRMLGLDSNAAESQRLAQELSYGVHNATPGLPLNGSGTSKNVLRIFSYSNKPIALVELGFSDNRSDAQILIEKKEEMAQGIVDGIDKYFGY